MLFVVIPSHEKDICERTTVSNKGSCERSEKQYVCSFRCDSFTVTRENKIVSAILFPKVPVSNKLRFNTLFCESNSRLYVLFYSSLLRLSLLESISSEGARIEPRIAKEFA